MSQKLIQTYIEEKYFVSTIYREASVGSIYPILFYETFVWEWDAEARQGGKLIEEHDSGRFEEEALQDHFRICERLLDATRA